MLHFPRWQILLITGVCLLFVLLAIPSFFTDKTRAALPEWLPHHAVSLGLDLRGGSQLLLEIDFEAYMREQLNNLADEIRTKFREQRIGYKGLSASDGRVTFTLREDTGVDIRKALEDINP